MDASVPYRRSPVRRDGSHAAGGVLAHDLIAVQPIPSDHRRLLREVAELHPRAVLIVQMPPGNDVSSPIKKPDVRAARLVSRDVDPFPVAVVACSWRGVESHDEAAVVDVRQPESLGATRIVDAHAEAPRVSGRIEVAEPQAGAPVGIFNHQLPDAKDICRLLCRCPWNRRKQERKDDCDRGCRFERPDLSFEHRNARTDCILIVNHRLLHKNAAS